MLKSFVGIALIGIFAQCNNPSHEVADKDSALQIATTNIHDDNTTVTNGHDSFDYKTYTGAWFAVNYPSDFTVKPSMKSLTSTEGFDSAIFTSPDSTVSFYVFSPQWSGKPSEINIRSNEIMTDSITEGLEEGITVNEWTIEAKDKSYKRSYREVIRQDNINWIVGLQYTSDAAYRKYRQQYLNFKNSLMQYAD